MNVMKRKSWILAALLAVVFSGCLKDAGEETIVLMGTESGVQRIEDVIPDTLLNFISDTRAMHGEPIDLPYGNTPPDIQGEFVFYPRELYADNGFHPTANDSLCLRFGGDCDTLGCYPHGQHNRLTPCDIFENGFSRQHVDAISLFGNGEAFAAYFIVSFDDCYEPMSGVNYTLTRGYIVVGEMTSDGIDHAVVACVNKDVTPNNPSEYIPENAFRVLKDRIYVYRVKTNDSSHPYGMAVRQQWYFN